MVEDLNRMFKANTSVLLINFEGVNVSAQSELRREISKVDSGYQVIKNRLALRAVEDTSLEALREHFQGPTAIAYTGGDPVALAKVLKLFINAHPSVAFKAGVVDGKTFSASDVELLAKMSSRPELLSKLVYLLNAPLVRLATTLQSPLRGLASLLKQLGERKQASGEDSTDDGPQTADPRPSEQEAKEQEVAPEPEKQEPAEQEAAAPEPKEQQAEQQTPVPEAAEQEAKEPEAAPEPEKPETKEQDTAAQEPEAQEEAVPETSAEETAEEPVAKATAAEQEEAAPEAASEEKAGEETTHQENKDD